MYNVRIIIAFFVFFLLQSCDTYKFYCSQGSCYHQLMLWRGSSGKERERGGGGEVALIFLSSRVMSAVKDFNVPVPALLSLCEDERLASSQSHPIPFLSSSIGLWGLHFI